MQAQRLGEMSGMGNGNVSPGGRAALCLIIYWIGFRVSYRRVARRGGTS